MGQALYRKYRSKSLGEIVGQEHITHTLQQALKSGRISHAYLFTGPRGVGKTSIARILAHEINGLPYTDDQSHLVIIEIDAASNRRIDEIRDLRDKVYIAPAQAKYKVYIIDEVHMLTREAFNALLKTLEEPPAHAVFILATTESHKLPETIVSRTQRFVFRPIETTKAVEHLKTIAQTEKIDITDEALALIAQHGDGSFRDSISLLDQAAGQNGKIDTAAVQSMLGIPPAQAVEALLGQLQQSGDIASLMAAISQLYDQGFQATAIAKQLGTMLRSQLIAQTYQGLQIAATDLLAKLLEVPTSHDPERYLEIVLLAAIPAATATPKTPVEPSKQETSLPPAKKNHDKTTGDPAAKPAPSTASTTPTVPAAKTAAAPMPPAQKLMPFDNTVWVQVLESLKKQYNTLYSVARMAEPRLHADGSLELVLAFAFHQKRLNEAKNRQIISDAIANITGQPADITCTFDPDLKISKPQAAGGKPITTSPTETTASAPLSAISNIFGSAEVLE